MQNVHEKGDNIIICIMSERQVSKTVVSTEFKKSFASEHAAVEASGVVSIFFRVGARSIVGQFDMSCHAMVGAPADQGAMSDRVESSVHVQGHEFDMKRHDGFANGQYLEHKKAVDTA